MSALVESGTGREGVNYSKVKVDDLNIPLIISSYQVHFSLFFYRLNLFNMI